tara:strand:- start:405 stop:1022 length:618 start_codon:yes stop_codon:yes gene_type:complete
MKKAIFLILIMFSFTYAQDADVYGFSEGSFYGGILSMGARFDGETAYQSAKNDRKIGFNLGYQFPFNEKWIAGIGYTKRGYGEEYSDDPWETYTSSYDISGFEFWAKYHLTQMGSANLWIGPSFTILTDAEYELKWINSESGNVIESLSGDLEIDDNDLSIMLGLSFPVGNRSELNFGYQRSITKIDDVLIFNQLIIGFSMSSLF